MNIFGIPVVVCEDMKPDQWVLISDREMLRARADILRSRFKALTGVEWEISSPRF